jgi:hypothetical protein
MARVDSRSGAEVDLSRAAIEACDAIALQPVQNVGVVAVSQERLWIRANGVRVEVRYDGDLIFSSDYGQHCSNIRVSKRSVQIASTFLGARGAPRAWVLDWDQAGDFGEPTHGLFVNRWKERRRSERRRHDRDGVTGLGFPGQDNVMVHLAIQSHRFWTQRTLLVLGSACLLVVRRYRATRTQAVLSLIA